TLSDVTATAREACKVTLSASNRRPPRTRLLVATVRPPFTLRLRPLLAFPSAPSLVIPRTTWPTVTVPRKEFVAFVRRRVDAVAWGDVAEEMLSPKTTGLPAAPPESCPASVTIWPLVPFCVAKLEPNVADDRTKAFGTVRTAAAVMLNKTLGLVAD